MFILSHHNDRPCIGLLGGWAQYAAYNAGSRVTKNITSLPRTVWCINRIWQICRRLNFFNLKFCVSVRINNQRIVALLLRAVLEKRGMQLLLRGVLEKKYATVLANSRDRRWGREHAGSEDDWSRGVTISVGRGVSQIPCAATYRLYVCIIPTKIIKNTLSLTKPTRVFSSFRRSIHNWSQFITSKF